MLKKVFLGFMAVLMAVTLAACEEIDEVGNVLAFDKAVYSVEIGEEVEFTVLNVTDLSDCVLLAENSNILSVVGLKVKAINAGTTTLSVLAGDNIATVSVVVNPKKLSAPKLTINSGSVIWDEVENASSYIVKINSRPESVTGTSFDLSKYEAGRYTVSVAATTANTNYLASDFSVTVVEVEASALTGIELVKSPDKTVYTEGDKVSLTGLQVNATYANGNVKNVTAAVTVNKTNVALGDQKLTLSYAGFSITVSIQVNEQKTEGEDTPPEAVLTGIVLVANPYKTEYIDGETVALEGLEVNAIYDNNDIKDVTAEVTADKTNILFGDTVLTISFEGFDITVDIKVSEPSFDKSQYVVDFSDVVDFTVLNVTDLSAYEISIGNSDILSLSGKTVTAIKTGETTITLSLNGSTWTATVVVNQKQLSSPALEVDGGKVSWSKVENAEYYVVKFGTWTGTVETTSFDLSSFEAGNYSVSVEAKTTDSNYSSSAISYTSVEIKAPSVTEIELVKAPNKAIYNDGEEVSLDGFRVFAVYENGNYKEVTSSVTCDKTIVYAGDTSLTLSFAGFDVKVDIQVKAKLQAVNGEDKLTQYVLSGEQVSLTAPSKQGFTFVGWYLNENFTAEFNNVMPNENTTVYARWFKGNAIVVNNGESIQSAIDKADAGSTIFVKAGTFVEYLQITKPLTLLGNNFGTPVGGERLPETVINPVSSENFNVYWSAPLIDISVSNVTVDGFKIDGDNLLVANIWTTERNNALQAALSASASSATKSGNTVRTLYNSMVGLDIGIDCTVGIRVYRINKTDDSLCNVVIANNIIQNFSHAGLILDNQNYTNKVALITEGNKVEGNYFGSILTYGLVYENGSYLGAYGQAIVADAMAASINNNIFEGNAGGMQITHIYFPSNPLSITNNTFINNSMGIWINATNFSDGMLVDGNNFYKTSDYENINGLIDYCNYAILLSGTDTGRLTISNNNIDGMEVGIIMNGTKDGTVFLENNRIANCGVAIALKFEYLSYSTPSSSSFITVREDNVFEGNDKNTDMDDTTRIYIISYTDMNGNVKSVEAKGQLPAVTFQYVASTLSVRWKTQIYATSYELYINDVLVHTHTITDEPVGTLYSYSLGNEAYAPVYNMKVIGRSLGGISPVESVELSYIKVTTVDTKRAATDAVTSKTVFVLPGVALSSVVTKLPSGYVLGGYYLDEEMTIAANVEDLLSGTCTIYTLFLRTSIYTFYDGATVIDKLTFAHGDEVTFEAPVKEGYTFVGWYTTNKLTVEFDMNASVVGAVNKSIYAKYVITP